MTRKDFQLIAEVLRDTRQNHQEDDDFHPWWHDEYVGLFADRLSMTNPNFDRRGYQRG